MQAVASQSVLKGAALQTRTAAKPAVRAARPVARVVCQQQKEGLKKAMAAAMVSLPSLATSLPALALVDERLNGDGTGRPLGIAFGPEGWAIFLVFLTIWALYATTAKNLGGGRDDDSGLTL